jgi:hypothetical protein
LCGVPQFTAMLLWVDSSIRVGSHTDDHCSNHQEIWRQHMRKIAIFTFEKGKKGELSFLFS